MNSPVSLQGSAAPFPFPPPSSSSVPDTASPPKPSPYIYDDDGYDSEPPEDDNGPKFSIQGQFVAPKTQILTIRELHSLIHEGNIDLNPPYQREIVWPTQKQALLIDSLFRKFYIPPVVFAVTQDEDGVPTRVCVDGKQRLTSIQRFLDGQLAYAQSKKNWYYTCPESTKKQRLQLPDDVKREFDSKPITCVEYSDLTPAMEREIFQRVQLGMPLTTAEKLAAIHSPWTEWITQLETKHISVDEGLSTKLTWETKRGREWQNVAQFVYCCDGADEENVPTQHKMDKWLSRVDAPGEQFKREIDEALAEFVYIASDNALFKIAFDRQHPRIAPIEFVFIGVLIYVLRKATRMERAQAIYHLRADIREQFLDIRFNEKVGKAMWRLISHLKNNPTTSISNSSMNATVTPKRKRRDSDDDRDYHPSPIRSLGKAVKTRSRRD
ncbi:hypothetical protein K438DRAFT_1826554 [Mycena galopus ATCC 62051]|nr:hypothetical protein K438DRAFT_1826554 [Mycena galopus ATCC 62051]